VLVLCTAAGAIGFGNPETDKKDKDRQNRCDEFLARYRAMVESRRRQVAGLSQGEAQLSRAYVAQQQAAADRAELQSQQAQALALLGTAGAAATVALGAAAAAAAAAGNALTAAFSWVGAEGAAVLDYIPVLAGGSEPALGAGAQMVQQASAAAGAAYSQAAQLGAAAAGTGAVTAGEVTAEVTGLTNSGLAQVDAAIAKASEMTNQLAVACEARIRDIGQLDAEIGGVIRELQGCPGGPEATTPDPRTPLPPMPSLPGSPPKG